HRVQLGLCAPRVLPQPLYLAQPGDATGDIACRVDPAGAKPGRELARLGACRGDEKRDRVAGVDEAELRIEQPDEALLALDLRLDRLAREERLGDTDIFLHLG